MPLGLPLAPPPTPLCIQSVCTVCSVTAQHGPLLVHDDPMTMTMMTVTMMTMTMTMTDDDDDDDDDDESLELYKACVT